MTYPFEDGVEVPARVAVCPYCDARLSAQATAWEQLRSGRWVPEEIMTFCASEPPIDSDEWEKWWDIHRVMPYVYQLPVDEKILAWMQRR